MSKLNSTVLSEKLMGIYKKLSAIEKSYIEVNNLKDTFNQNETKFLNAFKIAETAMIIMEDDMTICMANDKINSATGYLAEDLIYKCKLTKIIMHDDIGKIVQYRMNNHNKIGNVPTSYEFRIVDKAGNYREVHANIILIPSKGWSIVSFIDISELRSIEDALNTYDIAEWKRDVEELNESRHRFKEIADLLPGIICEIDMSFKLLYVNQKGLKTFGLTQDDFEHGINILEFIPPDFQQNFEKDMYNIFHGDFGNPIVYSLFKKDKSLIHVLINSAPIYKNGAPSGIRACIIDISDRVHAEEKLRLSEEQFRTIFSESPIGIVLFSKHGTMVDHNRSFEQMFCFLIGKIENIQLSDLISLNDDDMNKLQSGKVVIYESEHRHSTNGNDEIHYFEWHITAMGILSSENVNILAQVKDITGQKLAQEERLLKEKAAAERTQALIAGLRKELREKATFHNMVSRSPQMKQIFDIIPEVAQAAATVLISGNSGTGKELIARSLHELSSRKAKPFVAINCSALPDNLLESELFGYKAGAFTDAKKDKPGKFTLAEGGTIFLDEIGDISSAMQVKMLRVLQERVYEPLGSTSTVKANVRVIAATNKDIKSMASKGLFRDDLFYRINVVTINLPNLNDRRCDIPLLCEHFIDRFNIRYDKTIKEISKEAMEIILSYQFPGNIRELENVIEHAFVFCNESIIEPRHLPLALRSIDAMCSSKELSSINNMDELEKMFLKSIIIEYGGDKTKVAQKLGIHRATLFRKLKHFGLN